jgi:chromosome segregation ATPase
VQRHSDEAVASKLQQDALRLQVSDLEGKLASAEDRLTSHSLATDTELQRLNNLLGQQQQELLALKLNQSMEISELMQKFEAEKLAWTQANEAVLDEKAELEKRIRVLDAEMQLLLVDSMKVSNLQALINGLELQLQSASAEVNAKTIELEQMKGSMPTVQDTVSSMETQEVVTELTTKNSELQEELSSFRQLVLDLQNSLSDVLAERDQLIEERQRSVECSVGPAVELAEVHAASAGRVKELEAILTELTIKNSDFETALQELNNANLAKDTMLKTEQVKMKKLAGRLKDHMKQLDAKTADFDRISIELERRNADVQAASEELQLASSKSSSLHFEVSELQARLTELTESLTVANSRIEELQVKEKGLSRKLKSVGEKASGVDELTNKVSANERLVEELQIREKELTTKLSKLTKSASATEESLRLANETIAELEGKDKAQSAAAKKYKSDKAAELKRLTEQLTHAEEAVATLDKKQVVSAAETKRLSVELEETRARLAELEAIDTKVKGSELRVKDLSQQVADMTKRLADAQTDVEWALKDADVARDELAAFKAEQEQAEALEVAALRKRLDELQKLNRDRKRELSAARQEIAALNAAIEEEKTAAEMAVEAAKTTVTKEAMGEKKDMAKEVRLRDKEIRGLQSKLTAADGAREELEAQLEQLNADMAVRDRAVETLRASNLSLKADLDKLKEQAEVEKKEADGKLEALNDKNRKMKALLSKTRTVLQEKEKREQEVCLLVVFTCN